MGTLFVGTMTGLIPGVLVAVIGVLASGESLKSPEVRCAFLKFLALCTQAGTVLTAANINM